MLAPSRAWKQVQSSSGPGICGTILDDCHKVLEVGRECFDDRFVADGVD